jgi:RHS repeat-associated protein
MDGRSFRESVRRCGIGTLIRASRSYFAILLGLILTATSAMAAGPPPMTTPGQFGVSATGAATYSVPIIVPPGTAGLAPSLSLNYSSQSGNGILGFGWSLGGLPAMTRCPQTIAQDNAHVGVNYNSGDRFCLDGQRLLVINGGTYGADGSEYRTEIESFSRIIAHNATGVTGPGWFEVHTKSGQIIELGNSTDSRILAQSTSVARVWAASKISDTVGNYMLVSYTTDQGQYYPDHIVYTGNSAASVSPYNSVYFTYQSRNDPSTLYHAGSMISTAKLLSDIKTYTNTTGSGTPVTDYKLVYTLGNAPFSQLTSVQRCDGSGNCLAPTTFGWQTASTWPTRIEVDSMPALPQTYLQTTNVAADFNGDGVPDGYLTGIGGCSVLSGTAEPMLGVVGSGSVPSNMTMTTYGGSPQPACVTGQPVQVGQPRPFPFVDFNGDGLADVVTMFGVDFNNGAGNFGATQYIVVMPPGATTNGLSPYGDFDGDGKMDWFSGSSMTGANAPYELSKGDGWFRAFGGLTLGSSSNPATAFAIGDADGDGCTDLLIQNPNEIALSCRSTLTTFPAGSIASSQVYTGDFNGDGNGDFLVVPWGGANATLNISTGASLIQQTIPGLNCGGAYYCGAGLSNVYLGDFDGDGKTDVALVIPHYLKIFTWQSGTLALVLTVNIDLPQAGCTNQCATGFNGTIQTTDVDGNGCTDLIVWQDTYNYFYIKFGCHPPLLMTQISNGLGASTSISYGKLNDNQPFYTKCPATPSSYACGDTYPTQAVDGPIYVVSQIDSSTGVGTGPCVPQLPPLHSSNCFTTTYTYAGAKNDLSGRGFLGYQQVTATDLQTKVVETTSYNRLFPLTGTVLEKKRTLNGVVLSDTINSYLSVPTSPVLGTPTFVYLATSTVTGHEVDGTALPWTTTTNSNPDAYGNIQTVLVNVSDGSSKTTQNTYSNDTTNWFLGRLTQTVVTSTVGSSTITRTSSFHYNATNGVLDKEIIEPTATGCHGNNTACLLETDYTLDTFGHRHVATVSGAGFASRTTTVFYDANGTFVTSTTNNLGQSDATDYSGPNGAAFGGPTSHTDLNGLQTARAIDTLGRETLETRPGAQGTKTAVSYQYCAGVNGGAASCPQYGAILVQTTPYAHDGATQDGPATKTYYDALGRAIAVDVEGFDAPGGTCTLSSPCWIRTTTSYDANGNVAQTSRPYLLAGGTPQLTTYNYYVGTNLDPYGRPITVTAPNGGVTSYAYTALGNAGSQTSVTDALTHTTVTAKNAQGLVSAVTNALSKTTSYVYDAYGDLLTVTDPLGNQIANVYDIRGNKLTMSDPDMGLWSYTYDALGEVLTQVDPNERANTTLTTMTYDGLGRLRARTQPGQADGWTYDSAANGVGMLAGATGSNAGYSRTHTYDSLSRPSQVTLVINGTSYLYGRSYNSDGRLATLSYPSGFVAKYVYTTLGYLAQIQDNATAAVLWTAKSRDAEMHLTEAATGIGGVDTIQVFDPKTGLVEQIRASADGSDDGTTAEMSYGFDKIGNLSSRSDNFGGSETFCYDALNRLRASLVGGNCSGAPPTPALKSVSYDDIGNIVLKSDLADPNGGTGAYTYANPTHPLPHAVKSILGTVNGVQNPGYRYDADGNLTCEYTGTNCSGGAITKETDAYWSFNMTHTIGDGATSLTLTYDSEHARITQLLTTASTNFTTNYLNDPISGAIAEKVVSGSTNTWNDYLMVDGKLVGERICSSPAPSCPAASATWQYFVPDHLGSVSVVTDGTTKQVTARESFDAWGKQRHSDWSDDATCSSGLTSPTTRGFTSQEDIAALCLVNLNARLYDPSIGRFLSADSVIPDPYDGQSYNRYTYVDNRPLSLTDPTGHDGDCSSSVCPEPPEHWNGNNNGGHTDSFSHPEMSCFGNCGGSGTTLLDRVTAAGAKNTSITQGPNGEQIANFTCQSGSACENIGNEAVFENGGTITGENARGEYANFLSKMGAGVAFVELGQNIYGAVAQPAGTFLTVAFNNAAATVSENGPTSSGLIKVQTMSTSDPSGLEYWEPGARWNDIPDWEGTETWARSEVLQPWATYGDRMAAYLRQANVQNLFLHLEDQGIEHWLVPTMGALGSGPIYQFKNNLTFSDRNGDRQMDQITFQMGTALMINYGEMGDFGHGTGWRVYSPNTIQPAPPMGGEE